MDIGTLKYPGNNDKCQRKHDTLFSTFDNSLAYSVDVRMIYYYYYYYLFNTKTVTDTKVEKPH